MQQPPPHDLGFLVESTTDLAEPPLKRFRIREAFHVGWSTWSTHFDLLIGAALLHIATVYALQRGLEEWAARRLAGDHALGWSVEFALIGLQFVLGVAIGTILATAWITIALHLVGNRAGLTRRAFLSSLGSAGLRLPITTLLAAVLVTACSVPAVLLFTEATKSHYATLLFGVQATGPMPALLGLATLSLPILVSVRLGLFPFFVVDRHAGPIHAFVGSWRATSRNFWRLFVLGGILAVVNGVVGPTFAGLILAVLLLSARGADVPMNLSGTTALVSLGLLITMPVSLLTAAHAYRRLAGINALGGLLDAEREGDPKPVSASSGTRSVEAEQQHGPARREDDP
jgi:hypothetical protein